MYPPYGLGAECPGGIYLENIQHPHGKGRVKMYYDPKTGRVVYVPVPDRRSPR